jgi:hypothetical protein
MLEAFRGEILSLLKSSVDRREARVMLAQAQLRLTRDRCSDAHRDQFWKALLQEITSTQDEFAASDVFATAMADVTLYSIRCHRSSHPQTE